jgi:alkanesulfonate monooxygenase SsuD/methylene tetrahydromethanopterin reductase-like flavin-dependent oxidoreductase (luciferase family)
MSSPNPGARISRVVPTARAGIYLANYDTYADPLFVHDVAEQAAGAGWEGIFLYDHVVLGEFATLDPWTTLAAVAARVPDLTIGVLTAVPGRRHLGVLAQQSATLQRISRGRLIVGLGAGEDQDYEAFGDSTDMRTRAAYVELALDVLPQLWRGDTLSGRYAASVHPDGPEASVWLDSVRTGPALDCLPRIWLGGGHRNMAVMRRAAKADGIFPIHVPWDPETPLAPDEFAPLVAEARKYRDDRPLETATTGMSNAGAMSGAAIRFGKLDWWLELMTPEVRSPDEVLDRVSAGP